MSARYGAFTLAHFAQAAPSEQQGIAAHFIGLARAARHERDAVALMSGFDRLTREITLYLEIVAIARERVA